MATRLTAGLAALALAAATACAPVGPAAPGPLGAEAGAALALGDVREDAASLARRFAASAATRYGAGTDIAGAAAELSRQNFVCAPPRATIGEPPAQICRRRLDAGGCAHTWQVFFYPDRPARGLYDRACGPDALLGGPAA